MLVSATWFSQPMARRQLGLTLAQCSNCHWQEWDVCSLVQSQLGEGRSRLQENGMQNEDCQ